MTAIPSPADLLGIAHEFVHDPVIRQYLTERDKWWSTFKPRPDDPENFDQQHSFVYNRDPVSFLVGGNAAGTTTAAAAKCALFLLQQQPPPRKNAPFWIISNTIEQVCDVCWQEKLVGNGFIPQCEYNEKSISWHDAKKGWPARVPLKPWPVDRGGDPNKNWQLEFKSFEQGREAMQAKSVGGFWFSEQFPKDIFLEVLRGCREYMFPGGQFCEFTPIDPELSVWVEELMDQQDNLEGWEFYRANTHSNKGNLASGWFDQFFGTVSEEMQDVRMTGALATFEGSIYPTFMRDVHVIDESLVKPPPGSWHFLGTDWGASEEHPQVTMFGYRDGMGCWLIYDEYWSNDQNLILVDHAHAVMDIAEAWGWPVESIEDEDAAVRERVDTLSRSGRRIATEQSPLWGMNFADPSRPGEINSLNKYGIPTVGAVNDVYRGIEHVRELLRVQESIACPRLLISSRCKHLINELRKYRWKQKKKQGRGTAINPTVVKPEPLKRDDDTCDAMRYLVMSADNGPGEAPTRGKSFADNPGGKTVQLRREARRHIQLAKDRGLLR